MSNARIDWIWAHIYQLFSIYEMWPPIEAVKSSCVLISRLLISFWSFARMGSDILLLRRKKSVPFGFILRIVVTGKMIGGP